MSFFTSLVFAAASLCAGGIFANLACIVSGCAFKKKYLKARINAVILFFCVLAGFTAFGFIAIDDFCGQLHFFVSEKLFFSLVFAVSLLCCVFWKVLLPLCAVLYAALSLYTGIFLYGLFGVLPEKQSVTVNKTFVNIDGSETSFDDAQNKKITVQVFVLPSKLLLPLPRVWYFTSGLEEKEISFESGIEKSFLEQKLTEYKNFVLQNHTQVTVPLPQGDVLPAVYTLKFFTDTENLSCRLEKNL